MFDLQDESGSIRVDFLPSSIYGTGSTGKKKKSLSRHIRRFEPQQTNKSRVSPLILATSRDIPIDVHLSGAHTEPTLHTHLPTASWKARPPTIVRKAVGTYVEQSYFRFSTYGTME